MKTCLDLFTFQFPFMCFMLMTIHHLMRREKNVRANHCSHRRLEHWIKCRRCIKLFHDFHIGSELKNQIKFSFFSYFNNGKFVILSQDRLQCTRLFQNNPIVELKFQNQFQNRQYLNNWTNWNVYFGPPALKLI